jgi:hypothetical protein
MSERETDPEGLTSPGTVSDPELEEERAREAAKREVESRASDKTRFEQQGDRQSAARADAARRAGDPPPEREE